MAVDDALLSVLGTLPVATLGATLLVLARRRRDILWMGAFTFLWGLAALPSNLARYTSSQMPLGTPIYFGATLASGFFLLAAVDAIVRARWVRVALAAYAAGALSLIGFVVYSPSLAAVRALNSYYLLAFALAAVASYRAYRAAPPGSRRRQMRALLLAILLFPAGISALIVMDIVRFGMPFDPFGYAPWLTFATLVGIAAHALWRPPMGEARDPLLPAVFLLCASLGIAQDAIQPAETSLTGLFRAATAIALAYAILRHRIFDLDVRLRQLAGPGLATLAIVYGLAGGAIEWTRGAGAGRVVLWPVVGVAVGAVAMSAREEIGLRLVPRRRDEDAHRRYRQLEAENRALAEELAAARAVPSPPTPGRVVLGRYRLRATLGEGSFGVTSLADDERTGQPVAVKMLSRSGADASVAKVRHPNVVEVIEHASEGGREVVVMEYVAGGTLGGLLRRRRALPQKDALALVDSILAGLEACHDAGIVHGDVKPDNILLTPEGAPKLADFGSARPIAPEGTAPIAAPGTLVYAAPEQVQGMPATAASDAYAAAAILHQLLTGRLYVRVAGRDDFELREAILREPRTFGDDVPEGARRFFERALSLDPRERFADARAMRDALRAVVPA